MYFSVAGKGLVSRAFATTSARGRPGNYIEQGFCLEYVQCLDIYFFQIRMSNNNAVSLIREILHSTLLYTYSTWLFFFSLIIIHPDRVQQKCWKTKKTGSQSPVPPVALAHGIGAQISAVWATRLCPQAPVNTNTGKLSKHGVTGLEKSPVRLRDK